MYILILLISYPLKKGKIFYQFLFPKKKKKKKKKLNVIYYNCYIYNLKTILKIFLKSNNIFSYNINFNCKYHMFFY